MSDPCERCDPFPLAGKVEGDVVPCRNCGREFVIASITRRPAGRYGLTTRHTFRPVDADRPKRTYTTKACDHPAVTAEDPPRCLGPYGCGRLVSRDVAEARRAAMATRPPGVAADLRGVLPSDEVIAEAVRDAGAEAVAIVEEFDRVPRPGSIVFLAIGVRITTGMQGQKTWACLKCGSVRSFTAATKAALIAGKYSAGCCFRPGGESI